MGVTCILNGYKRPQNLDLIYEALLGQTVRPERVMLWYNHPGPGYEINHALLEKLGGALSYENRGVWPRFAYGLLAESEYVCFFDDDTVPGNRWLENCLKTMETHGGLLGCNGMRFTGKSYFDAHIFGFFSKQPYIAEVDIVGHSWFLRREWLHHMWDIPPLHLRAGEDMYLSYALQKHGIKTFVPAHPHDQPELWGSLKAQELGVGPEAISCSDFGPSFRQCFEQLLDRGWELMCTRGPTSPGAVGAAPPTR